MKIRNAKQFIAAMMAFVMIATMHPMSVWAFDFPSNDLMSAYIDAYTDVSNDANVQNLEDAAFYNRVFLRDYFSDFDCCHTPLIENNHGVWEGYSSVIDDNEIYNISAPVDSIDYDHVHKYD